MSLLNCVLVKCQSQWPGLNISLTHHLVLGVDAVVDDGKEPGGPLQRVGAARLQVKRAQAPVLQLTCQWKVNNKVPEIIKKFSFV